MKVGWTTELCAMYARFYVHSPTVQTAVALVTHIGYIGVFRFYNGNGNFRSNFTLIEF